MFNIINIELTSRCNKNCHICGRRMIDRDYLEITMNYGDIEFSLLEKISKEIPFDTIIQFHNNGEPLLYPKLREALKLFQANVRCLDTNGKLLLDKANDIIGNLETITISTFENDPEAEGQYKLVKEFLKIKGNRKPNVIIRCLGDNWIYRKKYEKLGLTIADRILHSPMGSFNYEKKTVVPEIGICLEMWNHPAIDKDGNFSICVRFDPEKKGVIGNINDNSLQEIWNGEKRTKWLKYHIEGKRNEVPLCSKCEFWGIPRG